MNFIQTIRKNNAQIQSTFDSYQSHSGLGLSNLRTKWDKHNRLTMLAFYVLGLMLWVLHYLIALSIYCNSPPPVLAKGEDTKNNCNKILDGYKPPNYDRTTLSNELSRLDKEIKFVGAASFEIDNITFRFTRIGEYYNREDVLYIDVRVVVIDNISSTSFMHVENCLFNGNAVSKFIGCVIHNNPSFDIKHIPEARIKKVPIKKVQPTTKVMIRSEQNQVRNVSQPNKVIIRSEQQKQDQPIKKVMIRSEQQQTSTTNSSAPLTHLTPSTRKQINFW